METLHDTRAVEREQMVSETIAARGISDVRVLAALQRVPRHAFVMEEYQPFAYADQPLPMAAGQTVSQPYVVAAMTEAAAVKPSDCCLEVGTGSGYQTAVLAELAREVFSIEVRPEVAALARHALETLGYLQRSVHLRIGNGYGGWPEAAPFDVIVVTAAPERVPTPLLEQLGLGGRLVVPVGPAGGEQTLELWQRLKEGSAPDAFERRELFGVRFVAFLGDAFE